MKIFLDVSLTAIPYGTHLMRKEDFNMETVLLLDNEIEEIYDVAVRQELKIMAIKKLREKYHCFLKDAKECVEKIMDVYEIEKLNKLKEIIS